MWLIDDLPFDFSRARVLVYGYDTKLADSQSFQDIESLASSFRLSLKTIRHDTPVSKSRKPHSSACYSVLDVCTPVAKRNSGYETKR